MKEIKLLYLLFIPFFLLSLSSCSDDDDNYSARDLSGLWIMTDITIDIQTNSSELDEYMKEYVKSHFQYENMTWSLIFDGEENFTSRNNKIQELNEDGIYRLKGNELYMKVEGEEDAVTIELLNIDKLIFAEDIRAELQEFIDDESSDFVDFRIKKAVVKFTFDKAFVES